MSSKKSLMLGFAVLALVSSALSVRAESVVKTGLFADDNPLEIVVNPVTNKYYVLINGTSKGVQIVDGKTMTVGGAVLSMSGTPTHAAININTNRIYVTNGGDQLTIINGDIGMSDPDLTLAFGSAEGVAVDPFTNRIYVTHSGIGTPGRVSVIEHDGINPPNLLGTVLVADNSGGVAIDPVTRKVFVSSFTSNNVTIIDGNDPMNIGPITVNVGAVTRAVAVDAVSRRVYVGTLGNSVKILNADTNAIVGTLVVGTSAVKAITVNPVSGTAYTITMTEVGAIKSDAIVPTFPKNIPLSNLTGITVNAKLNKVYVANSGQSGLIVFDASNAQSNVPTMVNLNAVISNPITNRTLAVGQGATDGTAYFIEDAPHAVLGAPATSTGPLQAAVNVASGTVYVANNNASATAVSGVAATSINLSGLQERVVVNPVTNRIYFLNRVDNAVTMVDGTNFNTTAPITVGVNPTALAVNTVTNRVYAVNSTVPELAIIDGATNAVRRVALNLPANSNPQDVLVDVKSNMVYVACQMANRVLVLDGSTGSQIEELTITNGPSRLAINTANQTIYVLCPNGNSLFSIDGTNVGGGASQVSGSGDLMMPTSLAVNPNTGKVYVTNSGGPGNISIFDGTNPVSQLNTGVAIPTAVAVNPATNRVYVTLNSPPAAADRLMIINGLDDNQNTTRMVNLSIGDDPVAVAVNPANNRIYVANSGAATLTVLQAESNANITSAITTVNSVTSANFLPASSLSLNQQPVLQFMTTTGGLAQATRLYYQIDSIEGSWRRAADLGAGIFNSTGMPPLGPLSAGTHIVYAYAANDLDSTGATNGAGGATFSGEVFAFPFHIQNNNRPTLEPIPNKTILEDAGEQTVNLSGITEGNANEIAQTLTVTAFIDSDVGNVIDPASLLVEYTSDNPTGVLKFKTRADEFHDTFGAMNSTLRVRVMDNGGTANGGQNFIDTTFTVTVRPVNDPPRTDPVVGTFNLLENAPMQTVMITNILTGPANEFSQNIDFNVTVTSSNPNIIDPDPMRFPPELQVQLNFGPMKNIIVNFQPKENAFGTVTLTVNISDDGSFGGPDNHVKLLQIPIVITIAPINDAPEIDAIADVSIVEDAGLQTIVLSGISHGGKIVERDPFPPFAIISSADAEIGQTLTFTVVSSNPTLIPNPVIVDNGDGSGNLKYTPQPDLSGTSTITVTITDSGPGTAPDVNTTVETFVIRVLPVNDAPSFVKGVDFTVTESSVQTSFANWATAFVYGPADENASQGVSSFVLTPDKPGAFSVAPAIDKFGTLTFTPGNNINAAIAITVSVVLVDNGGVTNSGVDTSAAQTFVINMTPNADTLTVLNTTDSAPNSLRDCMIRAHSGDTILFDADTFDLSNSAAATLINVVAALPAMNDGNVVIDASDRRVTINGTAASSSSGLTITSSNNVVRGLNIVGFDRSGITLLGGAQGNTIGGNRLTGVGTNGQGLRLGDNGAFGIEITGAGTNGNIVKGCWIGLDASGKAEEANLAGILIQGGAKGNIIGGTVPGEANVISGNKFEGLTFSGVGTDDNIVIGNIVGLAGVEDETVAARGVGVSSRASARQQIGNGSAGVFLSKGTNGSTVGGSSTSEGNQVSSNGGNGIEVRAVSSRRNAVRANSISRNTGGGIALFDNANDGITPPTFTSVTRLASGRSVAGRATARALIAGSTSSSSGTVEVFSDTGTQGGTFVGRVTVTDGTFAVEADANDGENVTATFTDTNGNTSKFSVFGAVPAEGGSSNVDSDADGVSDVNETLAGTNPALASDFPVSTTLTVSKFRVSLNFKTKTNADSLKSTSTLILPTGYVNLGSDIGFRFADYIEHVTLDANGKNTPKGIVSVKVTGAPKTGAAAANTSAKVTFSVSKKTLAASLAVIGLLDANSVASAGDPYTLPVAISIKSGDLATTIYTAVLNITYKAKTGKSGKAKL